MAESPADVVSFLGGRRVWISAILQFSLAASSAARRGVDVTYRSASATVVHARPFVSDQPRLGRGITVCVLRSSGVSISAAAGHGAPGRRTI